MGPLGFISGGAALAQGESLLAGAEQTLNSYEDSLSPNSGRLGGTTILLIVAVGALLIWEFS